MIKRCRHVRGRRFADSLGRISNAVFLSIIMDENSYSDVYDTFLNVLYGPTSLQWHFLLVSITKELIFDQCSERLLNM